MHQLERAIAVYEEWLAAGRPVPPAELLRRHAELAELLGAMLADRTEIERAVGDQDDASDPSARGGSR